MKLNISYHILKNFIIQYNMQELISLLIKSQRIRLEVYKSQRDKQLKLKEIDSDDYNEEYYNRIEGKISELELCISQIINLYNQIKNDCESTTTK